MHLFRLSIMDSNPDHPSPHLRHFQVTHTNTHCPTFQPPAVTGKERRLFAQLNRIDFISISFPFNGNVSVHYQKKSSRICEREYFLNSFLESTAALPPLSASTLQYLSLSRPDPPCPPPYPKTIHWGPLLPQTWRNICFIFRAHSLSPR